MKPELARHSAALTGEVREAQAAAGDAFGGLLVEVQGAAAQRTGMGARPHRDHRRRDDIDRAIGRPTPLERGQLLPVAHQAARQALVGTAGGSGARFLRHRGLVYLLRVRSIHGLRLLLLLGTLAPGCLCQANGHVDPKPFVARPADNVVNCNCNLTFKHEACSDTGGICYGHLTLPFCLPPGLNPDTTPDGGLLTTSADQLAADVDNYCKKVVTNIVYHTIKIFNGGWCEYKDPFAPDGGVGQSVECFAQPFDDKPTATARDTTVCTQPCPDVLCDNHFTCGPGVQDDHGNIHLENCKCNQITYDFTCPGDPPSDLPTPTFCKPAQDAVLQ
jgi:hypothetical protein